MHIIRETAMIECLKPGENNRKLTVYAQDVPMWTDKKDEHGRPLYRLVSTSEVIDMDKALKDLKKSEEKPKAKAKPKPKVKPKAKPKAKGKK